MTERVYKKPAALEGNGVTFINPSKLLAEGRIGEIVLQGQYIGKAPENQFGKEDFRFKTDAGDEVIVNSCGSLEFQLDKIGVGEFCQLTYKGKKKVETKKRGTVEMHDFEVLVA